MGVTTVVQAIIQEQVCLQSTKVVCRNPWARHDPCCFSGHWLRGQGNYDL